MKHHLRDRMGAAVLDRLDPRRLSRRREQGPYLGLIGLLPISAALFFVPSLWIAGVPASLWPSFLVGIAVSGLIVPAAFFLARRSSVVAIAWALLNAAVVAGLTWLYRDYYVVGPLAMALLVVAHAVVHGLRAGLAAALVGSIGLPVLLDAPLATPWADAIFAGIFLGGAALIPWTTAEIARRRLLDEHAVVEAQLRDHAFTDPVTGLANRLLLAERLEHALERLPRAAGGVAVLFLDLDGFKAVNDRFGHAVGDRVLRLIGERLRRELRPADTLARQGGDEFVIVLEDLRDRRFAHDLAARLRDAIATPFTIDDDEVEVTVSIGVANSAAGLDAPALLHAAELAMYTAKREAAARGGPQLLVVSANTAVLPSRRSGPIQPHRCRAEVSTATGPVRDEHHRYCPSSSNQKRIDRPSLIRASNRTSS